MKSVKGPKLLHIITKKGKGLQKAEDDQVAYHAPGKFDRATGERQQGDGTDAPPKYQDVFGHTLVELARNNPKITGITPAMPTGSSLKFMMTELPERAFDVGIAEQHAVTLAAGMAAEGLVPFCTIYSTFLQRAYDQVIHDVALQDLPVIFCIDRAGLVGQDGATHHGVYDMAFLRCIPNIIIFAPMNEAELRNMMYTAQLGQQHPIAIRYPRGRGVLKDWRTPFEEIEIGSSRELRKGSKIAILSIGHIGNVVTEVLLELDHDQSGYREGNKNQHGEGDFNQIGHYDMCFVKPLDKKRLHEIFEGYEHIVTIEDGSKSGGFGSAVLEFANETGHSNKLTLMGIDDRFIEQGTVEELHRMAKIDAAYLKDRIKVLLNE